MIETTPAYNDNRILRTTVGPAERALVTTSRTETVSVSHISACKARESSQELLTVGAQSSHYKSTIHLFLPTVYTIHQGPLFTTLECNSFVVKLNGSTWVREGVLC